MPQFWKNFRSDLQWRATGQIHPLEQPFIPSDSGIYHRINRIPIFRRNFLLACWVSIRLVSSCCFPRVSSYRVLHWRSERRGMKRNEETADVVFRTLVFSRSNCVRNVKFARTEVRMLRNTSASALCLHFTGVAVFSSFRSQVTV